METELKFKQREILPNVGRESHTYLYHIITNYHCLADVTLFLQGEVRSHMRWNRDVLNNFIKGAKEKGVHTQHLFTRGGWGRIHHFGKLEKMIKNGEIAVTNMTIGEFWEHLYGSPHPKTIPVSYNALFSVSRERILNKTLGFYKNAISFVDHHPNPEEGHYFERLWAGIFTV